MNALHVACARGDSETARLLLAAGANPSVKTAQGLTARDVAMHAGQKDIVQILDEA
jgi:ankyrin repeat protein